MRVDMWTPQQVSEWLRKTTRLSDYAEKFESLHIGGAEILVFGKNPGFVLEPLDATTSSPPPSSNPESSSAPVKERDASTSSTISSSSQSRPSASDAGEHPSRSSSGSSDSSSATLLEPVSLSTLIPNQRHRKLFLKKVALLQKEVGCHRLQRVSCGISACFVYMCPPLLLTQAIICCYVCSVFKCCPRRFS